MTAWGTPAQTLPDGNGGLILVYRRADFRQKLSDALLNMSQVTQGNDPRAGQQAQNESYEQSGNDVSMFLRKPTRHHL